MDNHTDHLTSQWKKWAFLYLIIAFFGFALAGIPFLLGAWYNFLYIPLVGAIFSFSAWIYLNRLNLFDFFRAKSTKNGLSNGAAILLGLLVLIGINFLAVRYNKSVDITKDRINSLSQESIEVLQELQTPVVIKAFYQGQQHATARISLKRIFNLYEKNSEMISYEILDAHSDPSASEYLSPEDHNRLVVLVEQNDKKERVGDPISEESITTAIIRLRTQSDSQIYFTMGHGERSLSDETGHGLSELKYVLESRGIRTSELSLFNAPSGQVPQDAAALVIFGPKKSFLQKELDILMDYTSQGGRVLIALDPESEADFSKIFSEWGVSYEKKFVASLQSVAPLIVIGSEFEPGYAVTDKFNNAQVLFPLSGSFVQDSEDVSYTYQSFVKTNQYSFSVNTPQEVNRIMSEIQSTGQMQGQSFELAVEVAKKPKEINPLDPHGFEAADHAHEHGHDHEAGEDEEEGFKALLFADADFASNEYLPAGYNKDLSLNALVYLSGQKDLITIHPNEAKPTTIKLTPTGFNVASLFGLCIPLVFLVLAVLFWFKRRTM